MDEQRNILLYAENTRTLLVEENSCSYDTKQTLDVISLDLRQSNVRAYNMFETILDNNKKAEFSDDNKNELKGRWKKAFNIIFNNYQLGSRKKLDELGEILNIDRIDSKQKISIALNNRFF